MLYHTATEADLWEESTAIPNWMKTYFKWHCEQREKVLNPGGWRSMKLFVIECLDFQDHCGGTSDRLKPLPTMLRMAAMTKRFLLIHWTRPAKLEEFLLPPKGGIDWRVPDWLRTSSRFFDCADVHLLYSYHPASFGAPYRSFAHKS
jgi:hypothetical protein